MTENKSKGQPTPLPNEISDETGQYDARFLLWRQFCSENGVPVETLPGDLEGEVKAKWEKMKETRLNKPAV